MTPPRPRLIRSAMFVGNSQSTFSQNVARVRKAVYKDAERLQRGGRAGLGEPPRHLQNFLVMFGSHGNDHITLIDPDPLPHPR